jgi:hypothetical protein
VVPNDDLMARAIVRYIAKTGDSLRQGRFIHEIVQTISFDQVLCIPKQLKTSE